LTPGRLKQQTPSPARSPRRHRADGKSGKSETVSCGCKTAAKDRSSSRILVPLVALCYIRAIGVVSPQMLYCLMDSNLDEIGHHDNCTQRVLKRFAILFQGKQLLI
jgi:hypothetical protein